MDDSTETKKLRLDPWLIAIVVLSAIGGVALVIGARNWALMTDELLYGEMSRSMAESWLPLPQARGELVHVNQFLYPLLIAPIVGLLSMPDAYPVVAAFNAIVMATAAVPIYLLAKMASGSPVAARWAALCSVCLPWLALSSKMLPDALAYTTLMWALYAMARNADIPGVRSEARPAWRRSLAGDGVVLLAILVTFLVRNQFIVLLGVWVGVVLARRVIAAIADADAQPREVRTILGAAWRAIWRAPIERPLPFVAFLVVFALVRLQPVWIIGLYTATTSGPQGQAAPSGLIGSMYEHLSVIGVALAGLPLVFGLPWLLSALARGRDVAQNQSAVVIAVASLVLIFIGASFNIRFGDERVLERYVFYAAPLILIAGVSVFTRPPKNLALFAGPAILGLVCLGASEPYGLSAEVVIAVNHAFSPAQIGLVVFQDVADFFSISIYALLIAVSIIFGAASWWLIERGRGVLALNITFAFVFVAVLVSTVYAVPKAVDFQNSTVDKIYGDRSADEKAWVDEAICDTCSASIVFAPLTSVSSRERGALGQPKKIGRDERLSSWWDLEFWNDKFDSFYVAGGVKPYGFNPVFKPIKPLAPDWQSGRLELADGDDSEYLVVAERDPTFQPQPFPGTTPVFRDGFALYELTDPPMAAWATQGLTRVGWIPPEGATLRVYAPTAATGTTQMRVTIDLASTKGSRGFAYFKTGLKQLPRATFSKSGVRLTFAIDVPAGAYRDIPLGWRPIAVRNPRLRGNAHVERISAVPRD